MNNKIISRDKVQNFVTAFTSIFIDYIKMCEKENIFKDWQEKIKAEKAKRSKFMAWLLVAEPTKENFEYNFKQKGRKTMSSHFMWHHKYENVKKKVKFLREALRMNPQGDLTVPADMEDWIDYIEDQARMTVKKREKKLD